MNRFINSISLLILGILKEITQCIFFLTQFSLFGKICLLINYVYMQTFEELTKKEK